MTSMTKELRESISRLSGSADTAWLLDRTGAADLIDQLRDLDLFEYQRPVVRLAGVALLVHELDAIARYETGGGGS